MCTLTVKFLLRLLTVGRDRYHRRIYRLGLRLTFPIDATAVGLAFAVVVARFTNLSVATVAVATVRRIYARFVHLFRESVRKVLRRSTKAIKDGKMYCFVQCHTITSSTVYTADNTD